MAQSTQEKILQKLGARGMAFDALRAQLGIQPAELDNALEQLVRSGEISRANGRIVCVQTAVAAKAPANRGGG